MTPAGFPHSDTPGSTLGCQLPRAYRRLLRPSSALDAKASTMCPSQLVTHTTNPTPPTTNPPPEEEKTAPAGTRLAMHTQQATKNHNATRDNHPSCANIQTSNHTQPQQPPDPHQARRPAKRTTGRTGAATRCSRPLSRSQTTTPHPNPTTPTGARARAGSAEAQARPTRPKAGNGSDSSEPQQCAPTPSTGDPAPKSRPVRAGEGRCRCSTCLRHHQRRYTIGTGLGCVLLRKEVIQPHLPVRLPCYDFVPIASPTFDHSPPCGLGRGLRVLPTFVT